MGLVTMHRKDWIFYIQDPNHDERKAMFDFDQYQRHGVKYCIFRFIREVGGHTGLRGYVIFRGAKNASSVKEFMNAQWRGPLNVTSKFKNQVTSKTFNIEALMRGNQTMYEYLTEGKEGKNYQSNGPQKLGKSYYVYEDKGSCHHMPLRSSQNWRDR